MTTTHARGSVSVEMAAIVAFLLIPLTVAVIVATNWVAAKEAATTASQAAARSAILESDADDAVTAAAITAQRVVTETGGEFVSSQVSGAWGRGETVTVAVTVRAEPIVVPVFGTVGSGFTVTTASQERLGEWRSLQ